jgi:hypothetical protein
LAINSSAEKMSFRLVLTLTFSYFNCRYKSVFVVSPCSVRSIYRGYSSAVPVNIFPHCFGWQGALRTRHRDCHACGPSLYRRNLPERPPWQIGVLQGSCHCTRSGSAMVLYVCMYVCTTLSNL